MIRRHGIVLRWSLLFFDVTTAAALLAIVSQLRFGADWTATWEGIFTVAWAPGALYVAALVVVLWSQGLYRPRSRWTFRSDALAVFRAIAGMAVGTFALLFLLKLPEVSRLFLLVLFPAQALVTLATRALIRFVFESLRQQGRNTRNVLIVGSGPLAARFGQELENHPGLGLRIIGYVDGPQRQHPLSWAYLGEPSNLERILHSHVVDEVAICLDSASWDLLQEVVQLCEDEGKIVRIPLASPVLTASRGHVEDLEGMPVLSVVRGPDREIALAAKRAIDVVVSSLGLLLGVPVFLLVALAIGLGDRGPILFGQDRVGLHGRRFRMLKFRTMVPDAETQVGELLALNEIAGHAFKITDDPRITRVGRFLRRTSLDEIPQLWNVLRGDMSLIGPRPPLPGEVAAYDIWHRRRLSMKPGITGLWQVEGRREGSFDRWVQKDLEYIDRWSLWLDARIALRTLPAMLRSEGR